MSISRIPVYLCALALAVSAVCLFLLPVTGVQAGLARGAGVVVLGIGLWATRVVPEHLTSIIFFCVALLFSVAPPEVVFSGFHSGAVWMVFSGLVIGTAAQRSGLGDRIADLTLRYLPTSYLGIVSVLSLIAVILGFLIPSGIGRLAMLIPFVISLSQRLGFAPGSRGYTGIVLAPSMATITPCNAILTSNVPELVMAGAAESIYGLKLSYLEYLLVNFPVLGIGSLILFTGLVAVLFGERPSPISISRPPVKWSPEQRRLLFVMVGAVILWMTDFLHGIPPAWIGMGAAVFCLLPRAGVLDAAEMIDGINYAPWFFVAGVIGLGAVATYSGLGDYVGHSMRDWLQLMPGQDGRNYAMTVAMAVAVGFITTTGAMPAVMTPLAGGLAAAAGWNIESVLMAQVPGYIFFLLPYQVPPVVLTIALANLALRPVLRLLFFHFCIGLVLIVPLQFQWARLLGYVQ
jgi:di/tricarboxylate transporter